MKKYLLLSVFSGLLFVSCQFLQNQSHQFAELETVTYKQYLEAFTQGLNHFRKPASDIISEDKLVMPAGFKSGEVFSVIKEPSILFELEKRGFSLPEQLGEDLSRRLLLNYRNDKLMENSYYSSFAEVIANDLDEVKRQENKGVSRSSHARKLDPNWLRSPIARYELVGIMNRLDRASFDPSHCGEMRFVYRLSYNSVEDNIYSRLPMTVMVKYQVTHNPNQTWQEEKRAYDALSVEDKKGYGAKIQFWNQCKRFAHSWVYPQGITAPEELLNWMVSSSGPIGSNLIKRSEFHSVETNIQAVRVPSGARSKLAGHAVYLLRVFRKNGEKLEPSYMENTLDVPGILADSDKKAELKEFLSQQTSLKRLDRGILKIPEKFLTTHALSYSPFGIARKDNRHLQLIFNEQELEDIFGDYFGPNSQKKTFFVKSVSSAAMRVNDLSCVGCHQGRATAGFHFLGIDKASTHPLNALIFEGSGHFELEIKRRFKYLKRTLANHIPDPKRDFSIAPPRDADNKNLAKAGYGHFCGLPGSGFTAWQCEEPLSCQQTDERLGDLELGKCFPKKVMAGDPCVHGRITQSSHLDDVFTKPKKQTCGDANYYSCSKPNLGHPAGTCTATLSERVGAAKTQEICSSVENDPYEICGFFAGTGFNKCVQKMFAGKKTFVDCAGEFLGTGLRGRCNESKSCRNDYVCTRAGKYDPEKRDGACAPSYFVFQVRADGHSDPMPKNTPLYEVPRPRVKPERE